MNTIESNKIIAEFMGATHRSGTYNHELHNAPISALRYHLEWAWLMPVASEIENMHNCPENEAWRKISQMTFASKLDEIYEAVIQFINWYNQNK